MLETMRERRAPTWSMACARAAPGETAFKRATAHGFYRLAVARDRGRHPARRRRLPADEPARARCACWRCPSRRASSAAWSRGSASSRCRSPTTGRSGFAGETKYPLKKMIRFALDALTGFSSAPLKLASHAGLWLSVGSVLLILYIAYAWAAGRSIQGWTSLMLVVVVLGAVQMFVLALMGEYIGRLYNEAKRRPLYIVQEVAGGGPRRGAARLCRRGDREQATSPAARASARPSDARPRRPASSAALSGAGGSFTSASSLPRSFDASALGHREREQQAVEIADLLELQRRALDQPPAAPPSNSGACGG